jgi:aspartate beta-hydroxylase
VMPMPRKSFLVALLRPRALEQTLGLACRWFTADSARQSRRMLPSSVRWSWTRAISRHLLDDLTRAGFREGSAPRFAHALDLLAGRRQIYQQQPQYFYFPEMPQIQFYERATFPWVQELEQQTAAIRAELLALVKSGDGFVPYMQSEADRPNFNNRGLLDDPAWSAFHLIQNGAEVERSAQLCPVTLQALQKLPLCRIKGRTPTALFSLLRPGAHIPPHHGFMNARLICHLPLIVPPNCAMRVGNTRRGRGVRVSW